MASSKLVFFRQILPKH